MEHTVQFTMEDGVRLLGVLHEPEDAIHVSVIIIVGGPQYRVGSHRQFVLTARALAQAGIQVLRFDLPGMGDSDGSPIEFEQASSAVLQAARWLQQRSPDDAIVLYGLCDGASAALMSAAHRDVLPVKGLICVNPWVKREQSEAQTLVKHYYLQQVFSLSAWKRLLSNMRILSALSELLSTLRSSVSAAPSGQGDFVDRMLTGLVHGNCPVLFIISGDDLTAAEFLTASQADSAWSAGMQHKDVSLKTLDRADHTFSEREQLDAHCEICIDWLSQLSSSTAK